MISETELPTRSDADLISDARAGDDSAFEELYRRHAPAVRSVARRHVRADADVEDITSEAFTRVLEKIREGAGPESFFRAYVCTTVSRLAYAQTARSGKFAPEADMDQFDSPEDRYTDPVMRSYESAVVTRAYKSLPERWRGALWYSEVDGMHAREIAPLLGLSANGVSALLVRAREGLRNAYLQEHVSAAPRPECEKVASMLGAYTRQDLSPRNTTLVEEHLKTCDECRAIVVQLTDIGASVRAVVLPLVIGVAASFADPLAAAAGGEAEGAQGAATSSSTAGETTSTDAAAPGSASGAWLTGAGIAATALAVVSLAAVGIATLTPERTEPSASTPTSSAEAPIAASAPGVSGEPSSAAAASAAVRGELTVLPTPSQSGSQAGEGIAASSNVPAVFQAPVASALQAPAAVESPRVLSERTPLSAAPAQTPSGLPNAVASASGAPAPQQTETQQSSPSLPPEAAAPVQPVPSVTASAAPSPAAPLPVLPSSPTASPVPSLVPVAPTSPTATQDPTSIPTVTPTPTSTASPGPSSTVSPAPVASSPSATSTTTFSEAGTDTPTTAAPEESSAASAPAASVEPESEPTASALPDSTAEAPAETESAAPGLEEISSEPAAARELTSLEKWLLGQF